MKLARLTAITKARKRIWVSTAAVSASVFVVLAANAARMLVVDSPQRSDVIVVLAGETDHRPARALELLRQGYARRAVMDVPAGARIYGLTEIDIAAQYVQHLPQGASVAICPIEGLSTKEEAHDVEKCLAREKGSRILIVTSDFHTRRALSVFRHEIRGKSFTVAAVYDDTQFGARWWTHRQWAKTYVDEWLRLLWWMTVDRWR
jgi:uncharacterized SAM-binding protein YcdF (DUF218 family)